MWARDAIWACSNMDSETTRSATQSESRRHKLSASRRMSSGRTTSSSQTPDSSSRMIAMPDGITHPPDALVLPPATGAIAFVGHRSRSSRLRWRRSARPLAGAVASAWPRERSPAWRWPARCLWRPGARRVNRPGVIPSPRSPFARLQSFKPIAVLGRQSAPTTSPANVVSGGSERRGARMSEE